MRADRDIIQIDVPQSYGIVQFSRTLDMLKLPDRPGIGFAAQNSLYAVMRELAVVA